MAAAQGLDIEDVVLYCAGRPLVDEDSLSVSLVDQATIDVEVRILGGKLALMVMFISELEVLCSNAQITCCIICNMCWKWSKIQSHSNKSSTSEPRSWVGVSAQALLSSLANTSWSKVFHSSKYLIWIAYLHILTTCTLQSVYTVYK